MQGNANDDDAHDLMSQADQFLLKTLDAYAEKSDQIVTAKEPLAERQQFLDLAIFHSLDAASEIRHVAETFGT